MIRPIEEIEAAHAFQATIPPDGHAGPYPWWYGHAIHDGYWAGLDANAEKLAVFDDLLEACRAAMAYDDAIQSCANKPGAMSTLCTVHGETLDTLYDAWISKARAAIAKATTPGD